MSRMLPLLTWLGFAAVFVVAGCGDAEPPDYPVNGSDEQQIRAVVEISNAAVENQDGRLLCSDVLPPNGFDDAEIERCGDEVSAAMEENPDDWAEIELSKVWVSGDGATATGTVGGKEGEFEFVRERGRWRMVVFD